MGRAEDRDGQGIVEHVIDHPVVADADPPRCLLPHKLLRTVWPGIIDEVFDGVEEPISDPPRQLVDLAGRGRRELDPVRSLTQAATQLVEGDTPTVIGSLRLTIGGEILGHLELLQGLEVLNPDHHGGELAVARYPDAFARVHRSAEYVVAWTGRYLQVTLMSIPPGSFIGLEAHPETDQFVRLDAGRATSP